MSNFELHLTADEKTVNFFTFFDFCREYNLKPLLINNLDKKGLCISQDCLTQSVIKGSAQDAYDQLIFLRDKGNEMGIEFARMKIEADPTYRRFLDDSEKWSNIYYETHIKIVKGSAFATPQWLRDFKKIGLAYSYSVINGNQYLTYRRDGNMHINEFIADIEDIYNQLDELRDNYKKNDKGLFWIEKDHIECCIYDTNQERDSKWID